jgi:cytochrome b561
MVSNGRHPHPVNWFGLFDIPELSLSPAAGGSSHSIHVVLGFAFAALVVLHVAGALRHQLLLRDSVLGRMIPGIAPRR